MRVKDEITRDRVGLVAAGVAFYGLLAIFPGIAAVMAIAGLIVDPQEVVAQMDQLTQILPAQAAEIIIGQARDVAAGGGGGLGLAAIVGILIAIYSSSKGLGSLMQGMNIAYDEEEDRGFVMYQVTKLALTLGVIVGLLLAIAVAVGLPLILSFLPLQNFTQTVVLVLRWPLLMLIAATGLAISYRYGPSRDAPKWRWITPGAGIACILWVVGTGAFAIYVRNFANYNETFGALGGVIVLLMWLWLSAYIVLLGAEIDSEMEAQTRHDSTVGKSQPMGQRGAVKADNLGPATD
nr:YihY/virulence factor BrkB family protein [Oceaniovalibus guishaninsula]